ncbi:hypothetical protein [Kitasatospora phosalacinea]|uniref:Uncharacterized protein n=1 Tax=Kitasatospora phosalacinea TaxID=2065 RepID=A0A9W6PPG0_9ACTN|nr:hypothetical protein [Kitasatospora phosalacinea]GLW58518.1 hypothetical protein Kpho01_65290 [Kitasatospora phosalacinea]
MISSEGGVQADLSHATMEAAIADGTGQHLSETITDFAWYQSSWWMYDREGWWRVTRPDVAAGLDLMAQNMRLADQAVRRTR